MRRILVVDDEAHVTHVLRLYLERAGYAVDICPNGQAGLEAILSRAPDALITDIQMPRMTGRQLCQELEKRLPARQFPIFVMTSKTDREEREWTSGISQLMLLEKPLSMRNVVSRLDRYFTDTASEAQVTNG